jgi:ribosomal protein S6--L-glutamate ligase
MNYLSSKDPINKNIIIIGHKTGPNRRILREVKKLGANCTICEPENFIITTGTQDKIYYKGKRIFKKNIDFVISRIGSHFTTGKKVIEHLTNNLKISCTATAQGLENASDKYLCSQILSSNRISTPKSVYFQSNDHYKKLISLAGGYPVVCKLLRGSQGVGVFIINDDLSGSTALSTISKMHPVQLQQYIETAAQDANKSDIRAFVVNGVVVAAMQRYAITDDFRSNYTISKNAIKVDLTEKQKEIAIKSAECLGLHIAGIDIVTDYTTKMDYVIEGNGNPGMNIEKITGINIAEKIAELAVNCRVVKNGKIEKLMKLSSYDIQAREQYDYMSQSTEKLLPGEIEFSVKNEPDDNGLQFGELSDDDSPGTLTSNINEFTARIKKVSL